MAPYVSVVLQSTKLYLPIEAIKVLEDANAAWKWIPEIKDAICGVTNRSLRDVCRLPESVTQLDNGVWDFRC